MTGPQVVVQPTQWGWHCTCCDVGTLELSEGEAEQEARRHELSADHVAAVNRMEG